MLNEFDGEQIRIDDPLKLIQLQNALDEEPIGQTSLQQLNGIEGLIEHRFNGLSSILPVEQPIKFRAEYGSIIAPAIRPIVFEMLRVLSEDPHLIRQPPEQLIDSALPRRLRVVMLRIDGEIGSGAQRELGHLECGHWVEKDGRDICRDPLNGTEGELLRAVVIDGVIPPNAEPSTVDPINLIEPLDIDIRLNNAVTRTEHEHIIIKGTTEAAGILFDRPAVEHIIEVVLGGDGDQGLNIGIEFDEPTVDPIDEIGLSLPVEIVNVIKEDRKPLAPELMNGRQFLDHRLEIPIGEICIDAGRDGEDELHSVSIGSPNQFPQLLKQLNGIRIAPLSSMVRIVLRRIDISIEVMRSTEGHQIEPLLMRPRLTVESLDDAANGNGIGANKRSREKHNGARGSKNLIHDARPPELTSRVLRRRLMMRRLMIGLMIGLVIAMLGRRRWRRRLTVTMPVLGLEPQDLIAPP